ncbi:hypothetical protein PAXRUDRAFT_832438 [Paxillus rubicundulus Ve08.2h10]|uniref:Unplaced genomic scaffold scaffold_866, whole genome shotgun sequence n=1 Tax=Paxillus rubicundulus Ve08.2h10 TaxID=930991 RepID=A0A0D0DR56_9AGAM|nr:hypothetical protein PAXRUDRAFT_832438 [Paxillus rubicundulus Ve08.2h10]
MKTPSSVSVSAPAYPSTSASLQPSLHILYSQRACQAWCPAVLSDRNHFGLRPYPDAHAQSESRSMCSQSKKYCELSGRRTLFVHNTRGCFPQCRRYQASLEQVEFGVDEFLPEQGFSE